MKKRDFILSICMTISLCVPTFVAAEELRTNNGSNDYILELDNNGLGYDENVTRSADQTGAYLLSGSLDSFDVGYGNSTGSGAGNYSIKTGLQPTFEANVPEVILSNTDSSVSLYNKLLTQIDPNDNPTTADGTLFALQIDTNSGFTDPKYVNPTTFQPDNTTNSDLSVYYKPCAQTTNLVADDTRWNCGTVVGLKRYIKGLASNTTYYVRAVAKNGDFTNSEFGPSVSATTGSLILSLDLSTNATSFGNLSPIAVNTSTPNDNGYTVYIKGQGDGSTSQSGLYSVTANKLITSTSGALTAGQEGYGLQGSVTAGSPTVDSAWLVSGNNVGQLLRSSLSFFSKTSPSLITGDQVTTIYKAAVSVNTPSSSDYRDIITYTMNASF
jgi:hypothetical protein